MKTIEADKGKRLVERSGDDCVLVHNGATGRIVGPRVRSSCPESKTMLTGSREELEAEAERLGLNTSGKPGPSVSQRLDRAIKDAIAAGLIRDVTDLSSRLAGADLPSRA